MVKVSEIEKHGIGAANVLAFHRALENVNTTLNSHCEESASSASDEAIFLNRLPRPSKISGLAMTNKKHRSKCVDFVLIDGRKFRGFEYKYRCIEKGESKSVSIAAASIVAKVYRDQIMNNLHIYNSIYGFNRHKGYGSKSHIAKLKKHGPSPHHRKSFLGKILTKDQEFIFETEV